MNAKSVTFELVLLILLLLSFKASRAQNKNFEKGFLINRGDTISGYILRDDELDLSKSFYFKKNIKDEKILYTPEDIDGFVFSSDSINFQKIQFRLNPQDTVSELRFAKVLVKGKSDLYKLDLSEAELIPIYLNNNDHVYILRKGDDYYTLSQEEKIIDNFYSLKKKYQGMLRALLFDCETLVNFNYDEVPFDDKDMIEIINKYNACLSPNTTSKNYSYKVKAISKSGIEVQAGAFLPKDEPDYFQNSATISIGYFWDIYRKDKSKRSSFRPGVNYMHLNYKQGNTSYEEHYLRFPFYQQFNFATFTSKVIPFIDFGLTPIFSTNNNFDYVDIIPFVDLRGGVYAGRLRLAAFISNSRLSLNADRLFSISVGWNLRNNGNR